MRPEIGSFRSALVDKMDLCYKQHIFEPVVLARDNCRFTISVTAQMVKELKNVMTSMMEDRTEGCQSKMKGLTAEVEVQNEYWKFTVSLRKWDSGEQARAALLVTGPSERVFSAELVPELMAGTTDTEVRETMSNQRTSW